MSQRNHGLLSSLVVSALLALTALVGCGGGGSSSSSGSNLPQNSIPPTVTLQGWTPNDAQLTQYKTYTFSASATDPNIGGTIAEFQWDFGDGTTKVTTASGKTTDSVAHAYTTGGTPTLSVVAKNAAGLLSPAATRSLTVNAGTSPLTVSFTAPASALSINPPLGGTFNVTFDILVVNSGTGTVSASGVLLNSGNPGSTQAAPLDLGGGKWRVVVTYPAGPAIGSADFTPTVSVQDSNGVSSETVTGPIITVKTVSLLNDPPQVTMVATPKIVAGANSTWQNVAIDFKATAVDPNGDTLTYSWTFGDAAGAGDVSPTQSASFLDQTHTYTAAGIYSVVFTADDGRAGGVKSIPMNLNILANAAPTLSVAVTPAGQPYANVPLTFAATVTDADGDTPAISWDFGDTTSGTGTPIIHSFLGAGTTVVTAKADDGKGGITLQTLTLGVLTNFPPVSKVTTPSANLYQNKVYTFTATATDPDAGNTITQYQWDFGDHSAIQNTATGSATHTYASAFTGTAQVKVRAVDNHGSTGDYSPVVGFPVVDTPLPVVTFVSPTVATSLNVDLSPASVKQAFTFTVTNPRAGAGATDPIPTTNITFNPNDAGATIVSKVINLDGSYTFTVQYPGATVTGTRTAAPTVFATDSLGIQGATTTGPAMTIKTLGANHAPTIGITTPSTTTVGAYAAKEVTLAFTVTDLDDDPVTYIVDWMGGETAAGTTCQPKTETGTTTTSTKTGAVVTLTHIYSDTTAATHNVWVSVDDGRVASPVTDKSRSFQIAVNILPTATILSPQASATLPDLATIQDGGQGKPVIPVGSTNPDVVVIPANSKLDFKGTGTLPSTGGTLTYHWSFPGGTPNSSVDQNPAGIVFAGVPGQKVAYLVSLTVTDATDAQDPTNCTKIGRSSLVAPKTTQKWVVVDAVNTQHFNLSFKYRMKSDNNGAASLTTVQLAKNGLGAQVQVFQDGVSNTYQVQDAQGINAAVALPVRSDLPFYIKIPSFGADSNGYMMRIPNAPSTATNDPAGGKYSDDDLGTVLNPGATVSNFGFASTTAAPWDPTLTIVTAQGFAAEDAVTNLRTVNGTTSLVDGQIPANERWLSRLSVPVSDTLTEALPSAWAWSSDSSVTAIGGFSAYQAFADWPIMLETYSAAGTPTPGKSADLEFNFDYEKYKIDTVPSASYAASKMQAFRIPKGVTSPYDLDNAGWGRASAIADLTPTSVDPTIPSFYRASAFNPVGTTTLGGGLQGLTIPYDPIDTADRVVLSTPGTRDFSNIVRLFSYSEYLWTKVWSWPLVLNAAQLNSTDTEALNAYGHFRYSNPAIWPYVSGISSVDTSSFNLKANGGSDFDPSGSPVSSTTSPAPSDKATGHFFWTVFSPFYSSAGASTIARTWLAQGTADLHPGQPPTLFAGSSTDATAAIGFVPPQDTVVDKRTRKADGSVDYSVTTLNGYRVNWFNPTKDASGNPVAPDFWVIELNVGGSKSDFMLPGNFPATYPAATVDPATMPILTDARTALVHPADGTPLSGKTVVAPGYCWFDVPLELRPETGTANTTITVYAVKSMLSNHAPLGARPLNRPEWIEAIKTASAAISLKTSGGEDLSNAFKIPFNYYWDIVITNGPITTVAQ